MHKVLVIDDEYSSAKNIRLAYRGAIELDIAERASEAMDILKTRKYDVIFLDIFLPDQKGTDLIKSIKNLHPQTPLLMISGAGDIPTVVESMKAGADDFMSKPLDGDLIREKVKRYVDQSKKDVVASQLKEVFGLEDLVDLPSPATQQLLRDMRNASEIPANILLVGPTGVGKSHVARTIHRRRQQLMGPSQRPYVERNCAAIPDTLIEGELFGSEKGAYTGAETRQGALEMADRGDLFLDEITESSPLLQVKLLSALQTKEVIRLGGRKPKQVDFALICATNRPLDQIASGQGFRQDLFFRIVTLPIRIPSLEERREDIPILVDRFTKEICETFRIRLKAVDSRLIELLQNRAWPGNLRELKAVLTALVASNADADILTVSHWERCPMVNWSSNPSLLMALAQGPLSWQMWLERSLKLDESFPGLENFMNRVREKVYGAASDGGRSRADMARVLGVHRSAVTNFYLKGIG